MIASWMPDHAIVHARPRGAPPDAVAHRPRPARRSTIRRGLPLLGAARLDGPDRPQRALQRAAEPPDVLLRPPPAPWRSPASAPRTEHDDDHHRGDRAAEQHEVEHAHQHERADEHHDRR